MLIYKYPAWISNWCWLWKKSTPSYFRKDFILL